MVNALDTTLTSLRSKFPPGWTIDIMCSDIAWNQVLQMADQTHTLTAFSVLSKKHTIIRGDIFNHQWSAYRHTLSHELGHVLCNCASESQAESLADDLEK